MARLFTTGFETGDFENNGGDYTGTGDTLTIQTNVYRTDARALKCTSGTDIGSAYFVQVVDDKAELFWRFAFQHNFPGSGSAAYTKIISFHEGGSEHVSAALSQEDLMLRLYVRGSIVDSGSVVITPDRWYMIEGRVVVNNSSGLVTVKVNGTTDLSYSGDTCATSNQYVTTVRMGGQSIRSGAKSFYLDDVAINDTTGSYQNSWIGLGGVFYLVPTADGDETDWTPSTGTVNYAMVDEIPADDTTTFVQGTTSGDRDLYEMEDCPQYINTINLVEVIYQATLVTSGYNTLQDVVKVGGTAYTGTQNVVIPITPDYALYKGTAHYLNPNSGSAWATADVNAMQAGMEIV